MGDNQNPDRDPLLALIGGDALWHQTVIDDTGKAWTPTMPLVAVLEFVASALDPAGDRFGDPQRLARLTSVEFTPQQWAGSLRRVVDRLGDLVEGLRAGAPSNASEL